VQLVPLDGANGIKNYEGQQEQSNQTAQHNTDPFQNFTYHVETLSYLLRKRYSVARISRVIVDSRSIGKFVGLASISIMPACP
jgi:hypothetical protein